jgi:hypothetical protein
MDVFTCSNYMEYNRANHQFCCSKIMYPQMQWLGVVINLKINSVKSVYDYYSLYLPKIELAALLLHTLDNYSITIIISNTSSKTSFVTNQALCLMIEPNLRWLIPEHQNKRQALNPISITLPNRRKIMLTHVHDINILALPTTPTGHIVPNMTIKVYLTMTNAKLFIMAKLFLLATKIQ